MAKQATVFSLEDRIEALRKERGDHVAVNDIGCVVRSLVSGAAQSNTNAGVGEELEDLIAFINCAKDELLKMQPKALAQNDIPGAAEQLDAIIETTEDAADVIMDAAENLSEIAAFVEEKPAAQLEKISTQLFEASSFQDITGQRISKVSSTLDHIEKRLSALANAIGDTPSISQPENQPCKARSDELLSGPQLNGQGNSQDDIDAIMAAFD